MSVMIIFSLCLSIVLVLPLMAQPLSLGFCVLLFSVFSSVCIGLLGSSWYGYILFLVYVGGLLVMFAYVSALAPNNFFSGFSSLVGGFLFSVFSLFYCLVSYAVDGGVAAVGVVDVSKVSVLSDCGCGIVFPSSVGVMVFLAVILLINLLAVVKVCYYQQGPLRPHVI